MRWNTACRALAPRHESKVHEEEVVVDLALRRSLVRAVKGLDQRILESDGSGMEEGESE